MKMSHSSFSHFNSYQSHIPCHYYAFVSSIQPKLILRSRKSIKIPSAFHVVFSDSFFSSYFWFSEETARRKRFQMLNRFLCNHQSSITGSGNLDWSQTTRIAATLGPNFCNITAGSFYGFEVFLLWNVKQTSDRLWIRRTCGSDLKWHFSGY